MLAATAALLPQQLRELGGVVQQQRAAGDERDAADQHAEAFHAGSGVAMLPTTTLEPSTLAAEFSRSDTRPAMTMAICEMTT